MMIRELFEARKETDNEGNSHIMRYNEFKIAKEDLVDPQEKERKLSMPMNLKKLGQWSRSDINNAGSGAYARGTPDPTDPFLYRKKSRMPSNLEHDAYYQYIKYIQPYADSNPFFPKVYEIILKKDSAGNIKPDYRIEKLASLEDAIEQTGESLDQIFVDKYFHNEDEDYDLDYLLIIRKCIYQDYFEIIKDKKLKEAILIIRKFLEKFPNFDEDLHSGNIMVRFGPGGPQLVFTDPVQDNGKSIIGYNPFKG